MVQRYKIIVNNPNNIGRNEAAICGNEEAAAACGHDTCFHNLQRLVLSIYL
jgi:hypothetical protein